jgi:hypothetical protein
VSGPISQTPIQLSGPLRRPAQLLGNQEYGGHTSIHDSAVAADLGFAAGAVEGAVHLSQFDPLLITLWGDRWFQAGCISAHYAAPCVDGEAVRAFAEIANHRATAARIWMTKDDGTLVLSGSASVDGAQDDTEARVRLGRMRPPAGLQILDRLAVGDRVPVAQVRMDFDTPMGLLYPFSLRDKLAVITEPLAYYEPGAGGGSGWAGPIVPAEMVSVLMQYVPNELPVREPSVGLFIDQEIRFLQGPVLASTNYELERTVVALGESRRTESYWLESVLKAETGRTVAVGLLHVGFFKESYPGYVQPAPD